MRGSWVVPAMLAVFAACTGQASANGITRAEVIAFLESKGLATTTAAATSGAWGTSIKTKSDDIIWRVYFPNCPNVADRCSVIQFSNSWQLKPYEVSLDRTNQWNRDKLWMKAWLSADTTGFFGEYEVIVARDCKDELLERAYNLWRRQLPLFKQHFFGNIVPVPTTPSS